jgi:endoglycosylceramidase
MAAVALWALLVATASAAPQAPFGQAGGFLTDASGRVFVSHGVNMVYKVAPYEPSASGFGDDDAAFLAREGFNSVRLGVIYKAVEPQPGAYDDAYLDKIALTAAILERHGITPLIDFHQDLYNERYQGEGWPDWAVIDDGAPNQPQAGFPDNYLTNTALNRAFDNFWANTSGPGDVGIGDRYAQAWRHVAARFAADDGVLGYDLLNEPWPGTGWQQCINRSGCPAFDQGPFADFYKRTIAALRQADTRHIVFYEPAVTFNFGGGTSLPDLDPPVAMSWHDYCLGPTSGGGAAACAQAERLPFENAQGRSASTGDPTLVTEFGATDDLTDIKRIADYADEFKLGWQYWHYCGCSDPTTQGPGETQAIVKDPAKPPTGGNVKSEKLAALVRPYPQLVAGTPSTWKFDAGKKTFDLEYSTARAGGGAFAGRPLSEVFVPKRQYPGGYSVQAQGAGVASAAGAQVLELRACPGAKAVTVHVMPSGPNSADCSASAVAGLKLRLAKLRVSVTPRRVRRGRPATFTFRVKQGRFAVHGARVRFAGHSARTNSRGQARIRVRLRRPGLRRALVWKRTYRHGATVVRVLR